MSTETLLVKVGGSLFDAEDFPIRLREWVERKGDDCRLRFFPGGGALAEVIRQYDQRFGLGERLSHRIALRTLPLQFEVLRAILPALPVARHFQDLERPGHCLVDPALFDRIEEHHPEPLPHCWEVTTDTIALRLAQFFGASALVLLKSVDCVAPGDWPAVSEAGQVDRYFPHLHRRRPLEVRWVNLRQEFA